MDVAEVNVAVWMAVLFLLENVQFKSRQKILIASLMLIFIQTKTLIIVIPITVL